VLRTFPELVWSSVQNLAEIGLAVRVKEAHRYIQKVCYIYIDKDLQSRKDILDTLKLLKYFN